MKYIDKNQLRCYFDAYTRKYLHDALQKDGSFHPKLESKTTYQDFKKGCYMGTSIPGNTPYNGWLDVLFAEQDNLCCYCMRRIENRDVSVEHLIPERLQEGEEKSEYDYYAQIAPDIKNYVMTGHTFDELARVSGIDIDRQKKMPHLIAHSNLFSACNSRDYACSCNAHRGNKRIMPLMLMSDVGEKVNYTIDGDVELLYPEDEDRMVEKTISALDINSERLKSIRKLWYRFSRKRIFLEWNFVITYPEMDEKVRSALDLVATDVIPLEFQDLVKEESDGSLNNFSLFLRYNWFYTYYVNKYPM